MTTCVRERTLLDVFHPRTEDPERNGLFLLARDRARVTTDTTTLIDKKAEAHAASLRANGRYTTMRQAHVVMTHTR